MAAVLSDHTFSHIAHAKGMDCAARLHKTLMRLRHDYAGLAAGGGPTSAWATGMSQGIETSILALEHMVQNPH